MKKVTKKRPRSKKPPLIQQDGLVFVRGVAWTEGDDYEVRDHQLYVKRLGSVPIRKGDVVVYLVCPAGVPSSVYRTTARRDYVVGDRLPGLED